MALILNILLIVGSAGIFAGRMYELINLIDTSTGYLTVQGVIFNPYILPIFIVITICCGIIILADVKNEKPFFAKSAGIFAVFAGVSFLAYAITAIATQQVETDANLSKYLIFIIFGAMGLIATGIIGLKGKTFEIAIVVTMSIFLIGLSLNTIILNVYSIYNIEFLKNSLAGISITAFFLFVFKNQYSPSQKSRMWLYITGMLCFVLCGIMNMADIVYGYISQEISVSQLFLLAGYVFIGLYALVTAFLSIPNGKIEITIKDYQKDAFDNIKMIETTQEIQLKPKKENSEQQKVIDKNLYNSKTAVYKIFKPEEEFFNNSSNKLPNKSTEKNKVKFKEKISDKKQKYTGEKKQKRTETQEKIVYKKPQ